jgi:hypothetical protein
MDNVDNNLILLNMFIINLLYKDNYFSKLEYNNIKTINNNCMIVRGDDCPTNITMKKEVQRYIYFFLLELIKLIISNKNELVNQKNI